MKRTVTPELLDTDAGSERELRDSLDDLARINHYLGGEAAIARMLLQVAQRARADALSVLDVGGGDGRLMRAVAQRLREQHIEVIYTVLDRSATHLAASDGHRVVGDALELPFAAKSFDVVCCNLFLHHLRPVEISLFVAGSLRIARRVFIASDLRRSRTHLLAAKLGSIIYKSGITRHDSAASVRRAYTIPEMDDILHATEAASAVVTPAFFFRMNVIAWR